MSDSTELQQDSTAQPTLVDTKDTPADAPAAGEAPAPPVDERSQEQPQRQTVEEPQSGGWVSWFQRVRKSAEEAVAICKHDLLEMTTQIKEDTTEAVESLSPFFSLLTTRHFSFTLPSPFAHRDRHKGAHGERYHSCRPRHRHCRLDPRSRPADAGG